MEISYQTIRALLFAIAVVMTAASGDALGQGEQTFSGNTSTNYNNDLNWVGVSTTVVPDIAFDEFAAIGSNTEDPLNLTVTYPNATADLTSSAPNVGRLILGFGAGTSGTLNIGSGGSLVVEVGSSTRNGEVVVGGGSQGSVLNISGTGSITADIFTVSNDNTLVISGPGATVGSLGDISLGGTYVAEITNATAHTKINATGNASLGAILNLDLSGIATPSAGDSWELIEAATIGGAFEAINLIGSTPIGAGQRFNTRNIDNGGTTSVEVFLEQFLTLQVNRTTGTLTIQNSGPAVPANNINIDAYTITSASDRLSPGTWSSLDDQDVGGAGTWTASPPSSGRLSELQQAGTTVLAGQASQGLGIALASHTEFGQGDDLAFQYTASDGVIRTGFVEYTGDVNTLVLQVDPTTGVAQVVNQSQVAVAIDGYTITSTEGALLTSWNSLDDQNAGGGDWLESNLSTERLSELKEAGGLTLNYGDNFSLGSLYNHGVGSGEGDLVFEFLVEDPAFLPGDFDLDGNVDGSDFLAWQRTDGSASGLSDWQTNFGNTGGGSGGGGFVIMTGEVQFVSVPALSAISSVPEPTSLVLAMLVSLGIVSLRRGVN